jgi:4-hydroxybenzoate polyprenyltransferase
VPGSACTSSRADAHDDLARGADTTSTAHERRATVYIGIGTLVLIILLILLLT